MSVQSPSPQPIFAIAQGFMAAKYLFAANELGVFVELPEAGCDLVTLAGKTRVPERTLRMLVDALAGLGLLEKSGDRYSHTPATKEFLSRRTKHDISAFLRFWDRLSYRGWSEFSEAMRTGQVAISGVSPSADDMQVLFEGIEAITVGATAALNDAYDFGQHHRLLDLGGGTGSFVVAIAERHPELTGTLFDIAPDMARRKLAAARLDERFAVIEGDFFTDPLPDGHDVILLSSIMHMYQPQQNMALLERLRQDAASGTRILLLDFWLAPDRTAPLFNALMAGEFLVVDGGDSYSAEQAEDWLRRAGWRDHRHVSLSGPQSLIVATAS